MKKLLLFVVAFIVVILAAAFTLPIIFKDDIQAAVDKAIDENLNAKVYYDKGGFGISLFKSFPDLSLTINDFGITGVGAFEKDTLMDIKSFQLTLDIVSVIKGEKIKIVNLLLDEPNIKILVLEDGQANYDIVKPTDDLAPEDTTSGEAADFSVQFQGWEIRNGQVLYDDQATPMLAKVYGLNHSGSGDFTQAVFDMATTTKVDALSFGFDGVEYMSNKVFKADITMAMDMEQMRFTFKDNAFAINNFAFGMDGFVSMPEEDIDMEINFAGSDIDMKSILSLVPGDYESYLEGVTAEGAVSFDGYVKGTFNEESMPEVLAHFGIDKGKIDYADSPVPMEDIFVDATFSYPSADLRETSFIVKNLSMKVENQPFQASLVFKDLEDYFWDLKVDGSFDLEKVTSIVPLEGMELKGMFTTAMQTSGRMSDLEAENYSKVAASGQLKLDDFQYISEDLPQGFGIQATTLTFNPKEINLTTFKGNAGKTDLNMSGKISNYIQYALDDNATLYGNLDFYSSGVYSDEWMTEDSLAEEEVVDTTGMEAVRLPGNIDFVLTSKIDLIEYDGLQLKDFGGKVIIRDAAVALEKVKFNLLDGYFEMNGAYMSAEKLPDPLYDFDFIIKELSIPSAFESFNTVKKLAPFAEKMQGKFSSKFSAAGSIGPDMMPVYEDIQGKGTVSIANASLQDVKLLKAMSKVTKLDNSDGSLVINDVDLKVEIIDGRVFVEPFDVTLGGRKTTISGSSGVDGSLDYELLTNMPSGKVGSAVNSALSSYIGSNSLVSPTVDITMGVVGTYDDPVVKLISVKPGGSSGSDGGAKAALKQEAKQKVEKAKKEAKKVVEEKKEVIEEKAEEVKEEVKEEVEEKKEEAVDKAKEEIKDIFKRKK